jgi:hypothetical protein
VSLTKVVAKLAEENVMTRSVKDVAIWIRFDILTPIKINCDFLVYLRIMTICSTRKFENLNFLTIVLPKL